MDGENPFRPDSDLYKEAEEVVKIYTLPRGSKSPSPFPGESSASSADHINQHAEHPHSTDRPHSHHETQPDTQVKESRSASSSSSVSGGGAVKPGSPRFEKEHDKENMTNGGRNNGGGKRDSALDEEEERPRDVQPRIEKPKKKDKKRKPVGCGGDKSCSIM